MNFWERVSYQLEKKDINKKTLAIEAGFDPSNITKGIKNNNIPSAETAVKIAKVLGVSVEYLVNGTETPKSQTSKETEQNQLRLYRKYHQIIEKCEKLDSDKILLMEQLADNLEKTSQ